MGENAQSILRMRKRLGGHPTEYSRLEAAELTPFSASLHKAEVYTLLQRAYSNGFGTVPALDVWWREITEDAEFDPTHLAVVVSEHGQLLGFIHSWSSAFIKDLAVADAARRRGVGSALLHHSFAAFRDRGAEAVNLKVMAANLPAIALYRSAGFVEVREEN